MSDFDIAVYLDGRVNPLKYRLKLFEELTGIIKNEKLDVVVLNTAPTLLQYEVIRYNHPLKEDLSRRIRNKSSA